MLPAEDYHLTQGHGGVLLHNLQDSQGHVPVQVLIDLLLSVDRDHSWLVFGVRAGILLHEQLHLGALHHGERLVLAGVEGACPVLVHQELLHLPLLAHMAESVALAGVLLLGRHSQLCPPQS